MKSKMALCQRITGILLCVCFIVSMVMPRYTINEDKIVKVIFNAIEKKLEKNTGELGKLAKGLTGNMIEKNIADSLKDTLPDGMKRSFSSFYIAFHSSVSVLYEMVKEDSKYSSADEMMKDFEELRGEDMDKEEYIDKFINDYNMLRIFIWVYIVLVILALSGILLEWFTKLKKWIYLIFIWPACLMELGYFIAVQFIIPGKLKNAANMPEMAKSLFNSEDLDSGFSTIFKKLLWCLHGAGYYMAVIIAVLSFIWGLWCIICSEKKQNKATAYNYATQAATGFQVPLEIPVQQYSAMPVTGTIRGIAGTFMGADIKLESGEKLIVGRDPLSCQLVLPGPTISRKHFSVEFNIESGMYRLECFSSKGLKLSDNQLVTPMQELNVQPGTKIIMSKGHEILLLV